ncbi:MAG: ABC transporter permease, partial [Actinomycetota bacterium]
MASGIDTAVDESTEVLDLVGVPDEPAVEAQELNPDTGRFAGVLVRILKAVLPPVIGIVGFVIVWAILAPRVDTSLGALPGPGEVVDAGQGLYDEWQAIRADRSAFYANQDARNAELIAAGTPELTTDFEYSGTPSFPDQIWTSLQTVALGFLIGTVVAVPIGLLSGLSSTFRGAVNPLVQIFKPVSPLAWLPIVTIVISATVTADDPILPQSFIISALVVTLNSL